MTAHAFTRNSRPLSAETSHARNRTNAAWLRAQIEGLAAAIATDAAYELNDLTPDRLRRQLLAIAAGEERR